MEGVEAGKYEFKFKLVTPEKRMFTVGFHRDETIGILKARIQKKLLENGCSTIPKERQRLLFNNQILQPDNSPIYWIAGVGADCKIHLVDNNPNENTYKSVVQMDPEPKVIVDEELKRTMAMIRDRFNTIKILQRNFDTCVEAAKSNQEPSDRARHNEPDGATPKEPDCRDLGYLTRDMAKSIQSLSMEMARLSDVLIHDDVYSEKTAGEYYKVKKLIQNVMDSTRYLSPQLQIFSSFIVPIESSPRRTLSLVTHANVKSFKE